MLPERSYSTRPDRIVVRTPTPESFDTTQGLASLAVDTAQRSMPKVSGSLAGSLMPIYSSTFWGIYFPDRRVWFLEKGTSPFTMDSLQGKTIPMWVDDPTGEVAKDQGRKAETRVTPDGRRQTLIFRKAAHKGDRKWVRRKGKWVSVPKSYPGAPGRIASRLQSGQIGAGNGGVRWRHPGINGRHYLNEAMERAAFEYGIAVDEVLLVDSATFSMATRS